MAFSVYILRSINYNKIYIGYTSNIEQRLISHNVLGKKGWTIRFRPWNLIYEETFETKSEAMIREKELKSGMGREWIHKTLLKK